MRDIYYRVEKHASVINAYLVRETSLVLRNAVHKHELPSYQFLVKSKSQAKTFLSKTMVTLNLPCTRKTDRSTYYKPLAMQYNKMLELVKKVAP